jgi:hypothetical protein
MNSSIKGFLAEQLAIRKLLFLGFEVSRPVIDTYGYDIICCKNDNVIKLQIKSLGTPDANNGYKFRLDNNTYDDINYFLFYLSDIEIWYIVPATSLTNVHVMLYDTSITSKYLIYREAWNLLEA